MTQGCIVMACSYFGAYLASFDCFVDAWLYPGGAVSACLTTDKKDPVVMVLQSLTHSSGSAFEGGKASASFFLQTARCAIKVSLFRAISAILYHIQAVHCLASSSSSSSLLDNL